MSGADSDSNSSDIQVVCTSDDACNAMLPTGSGGVCYKGGVTVKENHQMCDVTSKFGTTF